MVKSFFLFALLSVFSGEQYLCPMRCEGDTVYPKQGACPVCGMHLEKKTPQSLALNSRVYRPDVVMVPKFPESGEKTKIHVAIRKTENNSLARVEFLQVFIVKQDLSLFSYQASAKFEHVFPMAGNYLLFVQATPVGDRNQVFPIAVKVSGGSGKAPAPSIPTIKIKTEGPLKAATPFFLTVSRKNISDDAHLVAISKDTLHFFRSHPTVSGDKLRYPMNLPKAGPYRVWVVGTKKVLQNSFTITD